MITLQELDLGKNEMGPQAFRVIMMALSANTSIKSAVLSNNKTDTDTAVSGTPLNLMHDKAIQTKTCTLQSEFNTRN